MQNESTAVQVFNFEDAQIRTVILDGELHWVGIDVCAVLDIKNPHDALRRLNPQYLGNAEVLDGRGLPRATVLVREPGVFKLIFNSRKPEAARFEAFVLEVILPSIRATGSYDIRPRDPVAELDRLFATLTAGLPAVVAKVEEVAGAQEEVRERLAAVEESQRLHDPKIINAHMMELHRCKKALMTRTSGRAQPVTHQSYWRALHEHVGVASFQDRPALTVEVMEKAVTYARSWCDDRGASVPELFAA